MNKLLLTLALIINTGSLHGMGPEKKISSNLWLHTYNQLSQFLDQDIASHILSFQLGDNNLSDLNLDALLNYKYPPNPKFVDCIKALITSCGYGLSTEIFRHYFLCKNIPLPCIQDHYGYTSLHHAVYYGSSHLETIKLLFNSSDGYAWSLLKTQDAGGYTALHFAAWHGYTDVTKLLLKLAGDNVWILLTIQNNDGYTALHTAVNKRRIEVTKLLLNAAGNKVKDFLAIKSNGDQTAFNIAGSEAKNIINLYLEKMSNYAYMDQKATSCLLF